MDISAETAKKFGSQKMAFTENMGLETLDIKKGYVKLKVPIKGNENHVGIMYAGALFTLAEVPGGSLFATSFDSAKYYPVVKDLYIRFRRPAATDVTIEMTISEEEVTRIQADADENGKADYVLEGELKDESGEVVALSKGTYQIRAYA